MKQLMIFMSIITLTACGPIYNTQSDYVAPKSDISKMCTAQCVQSRNVCEQSCRMENQDCRIHARKNAQHEFDRYYHQRQRDGANIDKRINDFDRSYECNANCNCEPSYRDCYAACGGTILAQKTCIAFCDKK